MDEDKKRRWEVALSIVAPILTLVTIVVGVIEFSKGEDHRRLEQIASDVRRDKVEFRRQLWLQKTEAYGKIANITGEIIASQSGTKAEQNAAYNKFMTAYWGTMILVENTDVEQAMKNFYLTLRDVRNGWPTPQDRLKDRADELVSACRADMEKSDIQEDLGGATKAGAP